MNTLDTENKPYALLIDADNISAKYAESILEEVTTYGMPTVKRIYGDWNSPNLTKWLPKIQELALTPIQQFNNTKNKNASDITLVIDAMDILYTQQVYGFCLISSDSDYTKLATRLRESNKEIIGMGENKTPAPFIKSCNKFVYLENTLQQEEENQTPQDRTKNIDKKTIAFIQKAIRESEAYEEGWAHLSAIGLYISKQRADFDSRSYGFPKPIHLIKHLKEHFEVYYDESNRNYLIRNK